ncbi:MAG: response regulator [Clostridiales bacterium]|nr:response regulator [Clostridiales bacterium]
MKILVVEDDFIVRKGIILSLDWEKEGFQICGEAANGVSGFELVKELQPEIILTDIRMPREDGLSLSKRIRSAYPWMKIVILSGYDDFSYAKQALQIGVFEYLLKPIDADELLETVVKLKKEIEKEKARQEREIFQQTFVEENYDYVRSRLLNALISEKLTDQARREEVTGQLSKLGLEFAGPCYRVLLITVDDFLYIGTVVSGDGVPGQWHAFCGDPDGTGTGRKGGQRSFEQALSANKG